MTLTFSAKGLSGASLIFDYTDDFSKGAEEAASALKAAQHLLALSVEETTATRDLKAKEKAVRDAQEQRRGAVLALAKFVNRPEAETASPEGAWSVANMRRGLEVAQRAEVVPSRAPREARAAAARVTESCRDLCLGLLIDIFSLSSGAASRGRDEFDATNRVLTWGRYSLLRVRYELP